MQSFQLIPPSNQYFAGQIVIDPDPAAERMIILDRLSGELFWFGLIGFFKIDNQVKITVPQLYTSTQRLVVIIMDDQTVYDLAGADKVQADLVNMVDL